MDANGVVTAKSEVIQLKSGCAFLFALYNKYNDATFYIFVQGSWLFDWRQKIAINQCYILTNLHTCFLRTKAIKGIDVYKVDSGTRLQKVKEQDLFFVKLTAKLESLVSNKSTSRESHGRKNGPLIISYQGCVTSVKNSSLGIYELDRKLLLYTTFLKHNTITPAVSEGFFLLVCNAHLLKDSKGAKNLVCCGLSSVDITKPDQNQTGNATERNSCAKLINDIGLNFLDFKWLEHCLEVLSDKFYPSTAYSTHGSPFSSKIMEIIIPNLIRCRNGVTNKNEEDSLPRCIINEFISDPHSCVITKQSNLGKEFTFLSVSEILSRPKDDILSYHSKHWRCSLVCIEDDVVLVGFLLVSKDGNTCLADSSSKVPLVFSGDVESFVSCSFNSIKELLKSSVSNKVLVALKDFHVICEETLDETKQINFCIYGRISYISPLCELTDISEMCDSFKELSMECFGDQDVNTSVRNPCSFSEAFVQSSLSKSVVSLEMGKGSCSWKHEEVNSRYIKQKIIICGKTLPFMRNGTLHQEVLVLLLGSESVEKTAGQSDTEPESLEFIPSAEKNYVETGTEVKPAMLSFKDSTSGDYAVLFPYFLYSMLLPTDTDKNATTFSCLSNTSYCNNASVFEAWSEITVIEVSLGSRFIIESGSNLKLQTVLNKNLASLPEKYNVEEVLHKRSLNKFDFVQGIVIDRWIEEANLSESHLNASKDNHVSRKTLVFDLKDCNTSDSIRVYASKFIFPVPGLIPGATVEIFGFSCHCSKRGNLYLKSDGPFGVHLVNINEELAKEIYQSYHIKGKQFNQEQIPWNFLNRVVANKKFKSVCFVLKILKAEVFGVCTHCGENTLKCCVCTSKLFMKSKASFLVDDGSSQNFVFCAEDNVRVLLSLDHLEWNALTSYVQDARKSLTYDHKIQASETFSTPSLFNYLCSSCLVRRQIVMECHPYLSSDRFPGNSDSRANNWDNKGKGLRLFAFSIYEPKSRDVALEYLNHLQKRMK